MKKSLIIQIPEPCSENWALMHPTQSGRSCDACAKEVIDFTGYSDRQLILFNEQHRHQEICGRYYSFQLDRELTFNDFQGHRFSRLSALVFAALAMTSVSVYAQEPAASRQQVIVLTDTSVAVDPIKALIITGQIFDAYSKKPAQFAVITLSYEGNTIASTVGDTNGYFKITISEDQHFDFIRIKAKYHLDFGASLNNQSRLELGEIRLEADPMIFEIGKKLEPVSVETQILHKKEAEKKAGKKGQ